MIEWLPVLRALVENAAMPPLNVILAERGLEPSIIFTVPVGIPAAGDDGFTVMENTTVCPAADGLAEDTTVAVVNAWLTAWAMADEVLEAKLVSPL